MDALLSGIISIILELNDFTIFVLFEKSPSFSNMRKDRLCHDAADMETDLWCLAGRKSPLYRFP